MRFRTIQRRRDRSKISAAFYALTAALLVLQPHANAITDEAPSTGPTVFRVGPQKQIQLPSEAAALAKDGDTIEIDAATYTNDYATWTQNNLTIRGVNGYAHMASNELIPNGKAIWIIAGSDTHIENIEFSGAAVEDTNGAGLRHEGGNLRLHNLYFHHNEFSVLTGGQEDTTLDITDSRFWYHQREARYSHGIYIGAIDKFSITGSHFKGTDRGHQIKSRALENHILYNRIEDIPNGNSSRLVDLPNCGLSIIMGNDMHQAPTTHNVDAIGYGAEGCDERSERQLQLFVMNNTFVNEVSGGSLVRNHWDAKALVANNLVVGRGFYLLGNGTKDNNARNSLPRWQRGSWTPVAGSSAIDAAKSFPPFEGRLLAPTKVFVSPAGSRARVNSGPLDVGARDYLKREK